MAKLFKSQLKIKFRDGDPAQIMYFGNLFSFAHDAFEEFIVEAGYQWKEWFRTKIDMVPIRHADADFLAPFIPGETYEVTAQVENLGDTSFIMKYTFGPPAQPHATVRMVHAWLDAQTKQKKPLPELFRQRMEPYLERK